MVTFYCEPTLLRNVLSGSSLGPWLKMHPSREGLPLLLLKSQGLSQLSVTVTENSSFGVFWPLQVICIWDPNPGSGVSDSSGSLSPSPTSPSLYQAIRHLCPMSHSVGQICLYIFFFLIHLLTLLPFWGSLSLNLNPNLDPCFVVFPTCPFRSQALRCLELVEYTQLSLTLDGRHFFLRVCVRFLAF